MNTSVPAKLNSRNKLNVGTEAAQRSGRKPSLTLEYTLNPTDGHAGSHDGPREQTEYRQAF